jgi:saccharopine dehydrogenase (NAD+, L-lysine-forming)
VVAPRHSLRPLTRLLRWGLNRFSRPPFGTLLQLEASGQAGGAPQRLALSIGHADGYALTAIPAAACLRQYLEGGAQPGLWLQGEWVEPEQFMHDLARLGATVRLAVNGQPPQALEAGAQQSPPRKEKAHDL